LNIYTEHEESCGEPSSQKMAIGDDPDCVVYFCQDHYLQHMKQMQKEEQEDAFTNEHGYPPGFDITWVLIRLGRRISKARHHRLQSGEHSPLTIAAENLVEETLGHLRAWLLDHVGDGCSYRNPITLAATRVGSLRREDLPPRVGPAFAAGLARALEMATEMDMKPRPKSD
jgi:hypothetical protein